MKRISLPYLCDIHNKINHIREIPIAEKPFQEIFYDLILARTAISQLHAESIYSTYLKVSFESSQNLINIINTELENKEYNRIISPYSISIIRQAADNYSIALTSELGVLDSYFITRKGPFDTSKLLLSGETLFPADLAEKVPEAIQDIRSAAQCLAYEMPTACAFHVFRATESVLRRYYSQTTTGSPPPRVRNFSVYIEAMKKSGAADGKILSALKQMVDLHRNPLIHPEAVLTIEEAMSVIGLARSVVQAMLATLPVLPPTTTVAPFDPLN